MPEFVRKDGSALFASQIELSLSINGWDHTSLMFKPPADFDAKVYSDAYAESKQEINTAQAARFTESLANAPIPYMVYDVTSQLWSIGTELVAPPKIKDLVLAKASSWKTYAGNRLTGYHRWDLTGTGMAAGRYSRLTCGLITPCPPERKAAYDAWILTQPETLVKDAFFADEMGSIADFVRSLDLVPAEWTKITSLYGNNQTIDLYDCHAQRSSSIGGYLKALRKSGVCKRGHSYIITSPDMYGNCAILEGPLCDFALLVMTRYLDNGYVSSVYENIAPQFVKADGSTMTLPGGKVVTASTASIYYDGPYAYEWDGSVTLSGAAPSTSLATDAGLLVDAVTLYAGQNVYKLNGWRWALNGFTEWAFRDLTNFSRTVSPHKLTGTARAVHAKMPVASFRSFMDAAGRDKDGALLPELAKARDDLAGYMDGQFLVSVHAGQRALGRADLSALPIVGKVQKAGKMDEDLGSGITMRKGIARLDKAFVAQKEFTSFARLHDESVDVENLIGSYVQSITERGLASVVVVTATPLAGGTYTYAMSGGASGAVSELETQWLVANGASLTGAGVDAVTVEDSWALGDDWRADLLDFKNATPSVEGRPLTWATPFIASGDNLSITDVCDRNGFPLIDCNQKVKQLICKGLSQDGSEQLSLPLFISPSSLIGDEA